MASRVVCILLRIARILVVRFTIAGLLSVDVRNRRLRSATISLYRSIAPATPASCKPTFAGSTSYPLPCKYFFKSITRLICVWFSTRFFSYSALPVKAIWASLVKSVIPALRLKFSRSRSVLPNSFEMISIRSSMNSAVLWATSFLSLLALILYISSNLLIKSLPRRALEFFNDITTTEVIFDVGDIDRELVYLFATEEGLLIKAVICRSCVTLSGRTDDSVSLFTKKATVPSSVGNTAGNFSNCFRYSFSPIVICTSIAPAGCKVMFTFIECGSLSASCGVKLTTTGEVR